MYRMMSPLDFVISLHVSHTTGWAHMLVYTSKTKGACAVYKKCFTNLALQELFYNKDLCRNCFIYITQSMYYVSL